MPDTKLADSTRVFCSDVANWLRERPAEKILAEEFKTKDGQKLGTVIDLFKKAAATGDHSPIEIEHTLGPGSIPSYRTLIKRFFEIANGGREIKVVETKLKNLSGGKKPQARYRLELHSERPPGEREWQGDLFGVMIRFPTWYVELSKQEQERRRSAVRAIASDLHPSFAAKMEIRSDESLLIYASLDQTCVVDLMQFASALCRHPELRPAVIACDLIGDVDLHEVGGVTLGWKINALDRLERLSRLEMPADYQAHGCRISPTEVPLVITEPLHRLAMHIGSYESIGCISVGSAEPGYLPVWRVWRLSESWYSFPPKIAEFVNELVASRPQAAESSAGDQVAEIHTDDEVAGSRVVGGVLEHLARTSRFRVMHWDCRRQRGDDLLEPTTESLRDFFGTNCRAKAFHPKEPIERRLKELSQQAAFSRVSDLLFGSLNGEHFDGINEHIVHVLKAEKLRLIVVENPDFADELTTSLLRELLANPGNLHILLVGPKGKFFDAKHRVCELFAPDQIESWKSEDQQLIDRLQKDRVLWPAALTAAALGWGILRSWWKHVLQSLEETKHRPFDDIIADLLRLGVVKYAGCHPEAEPDPASSSAGRASPQRAGERGPLHKYRDVKFCSATLAERLQELAQADRAFFDRVADAFISKLRERILNRVIEVGQVRCKLRVCDLVRRCWTNHIQREAIQGLSREILLLYWYIGKRACDAQAGQQARRRTEFAYQFLTDVNANDGDVVLPILCLRLQLRLLDSDEKDQSIITGVQSKVEAMRSNGSVGNLLDFEISRMVWAWMQSSGSVESAQDQTATLLDSWKATISGVWHHQLPQPPTDLMQAQAAAGDPRADLLREFFDPARRVIPRSDLLKEYFHAGSVSHFFGSDFESAITAATLGRSLCEVMHMQDPSPPSSAHSKHNVFSCCKAFLGLSLLIRGHCRLPSWESPHDVIEVTCDYTFGGKGYKPQDALTRLIISSYVSLFHVLQFDFRQAKELLLQQPNQCQNDERWTLFRELMEICIDIGGQWQTRWAAGGAAPNGVLSARLDRLREQRQRYTCQDGRSLMSTFEGLGRALLRQPKEAEACFQQAEKFAMDRHELFFLPHTYLYWAWSLQEFGELDHSQQKRRLGEECASEMQAGLYLEQLSGDISRFALINAT